MPIDRDPVSTKPPTLKFVNSIKHSLNGYADNVTMLSSDIDVHKSVLQSLDIRATDIDLCFKPSKCV